jgi:hypothetical protein
VLKKRKYEGRATVDAGRYRKMEKTKKERKERIGRREKRICIYVCFG